VGRTIWDVSEDARFLSAFRMTDSEIIVPVFDQDVCVGTIDRESQAMDAFSATSRGEDIRRMSDESSTIRTRVIKPAPHPAIPVGASIVVLPTPRGL
jgi:hypothetical protein